MYIPKIYAFCFAAFCLWIGAGRVYPYLLGLLHLHLGHHMIATVTVK